MNYVNLLIMQFMAHILAEFIFQPDKTIKEKNDKGFKSSALVIHSMVVFLLSWIFSLQFNFFVAALIITITHYLMDGIKIVLSKKEELKNKAFFFDQSFHVIVIFTVVTIFAKYYPFEPVVNFSFDTKILLVIAAYLFCTKPANIIIKEILNAYKINIPKNSAEDIPNAGKLIGDIERIITLSLILNDQFGAVGFIIAAKSILRFKDTDTGKTEYVLIGTLLSFGIAIIIGILIQLYK